MEPARRETNGYAIASLVLGIVGLSFPIASIVALVLGYRARREIAASPETQSGDGLATAGIVLGWVGVAILATFVVIGLLVLLLVAV